MTQRHELLLHTQGLQETVGKLEHYHFPPYITLAHLFSAPAGWAIEPRALSQYQLQYVVSGMAHYHIEGTDYMTKRGDLLMHRPGEHHYVRMVEGQPYVCISIVFHLDGKSHLLDQLFDGRHDLGNYSEDTVEQLLSRIVTHYRQPGQSRQLLCQGLLLQLLAELSEKSRTERAGEGISERVMAKLILVRNHILQHYQEIIQYRQLEAVSGMSKNYLSAKFGQIFGMTPFEYLIWTRMEKAKELAIHSNLSIGEIANRVGYADVHTFGRMFKKKNGVSLSQFCASLVTLADGE